MRIVQVLHRNPEGDTWYPTAYVQLPDGRVLFERLEVTLADLRENEHAIRDAEKLVRTNLQETLNGIQNHQRD